MAGYADVKRRIKSVENTRQITRTMELVATSKLKRATDRVRATRPYAEALHEIVSGLYSPSLSEKYPILRRPDVTKRAAILLCTANRGLAGGFNANLIKRARNLMEDLRGQGIETELHVAGKKGIAFFRFRGVEMLTQRTDISDHPTVDDAESLIAPIRERFESGDQRVQLHIGVHPSESVSESADDAPEGGQSRSFETQHILFPQRPVQRGEVPSLSSTPFVFGK
mgnify:CR=1 FL=1